ncbi:MAG: hypothetical protein ACRD0K_28895 [Egibacteraceae bacterium]
MTRPERAIPKTASGSPIVAITSDSHRLGVARTVEAGVRATANIALASAHPTSPPLT